MSNTNCQILKGGQSCSVDDYKNATERILDGYLKKQPKCIAVKLDSQFEPFWEYNECLSNPLLSRLMSIADDAPIKIVARRLLYTIRMELSLGVLTLLRSTQRVLTSI